jgi:hypothetical protein
VASLCTVSNGKIINNELESVWKKVVATYLR